ncbi:hypothetical protein Lser_V15G14679 [Lactuca serriola]
MNMCHLMQTIVEENKKFVAFIAQKLNKSSSNMPNYYSRVISLNGDEHIIIFAKRDIAQWEELTYEYSCRGVVNGIDADVQILTLVIISMFGSYLPTILPKSLGTNFPLEDDVPQYHVSLPPPHPIILPNPQVRRLEKFKITQALLDTKHKDGKSVCAHVLDMKSHIGRMRMLGVVFPRKLAYDWVLQSLTESYSEFAKDYYMTDHDITLIDLTYLLIAAESAMIWRNGEANLTGRSTSQADMGNDMDIPEMIPSPKGKELAMIKSFDHKGKAKSEIVPYVIPNEHICFYCQGKGHWNRSCRDYLRTLVRLYGSSSDHAKGRKLKGRVC